MPAVLSAATVACSVFSDYPVLWHNSANKFFDALAASRPIMINYQGWQADLLQETGAGIVLPVDDIGAAAAQLVDFLHDDDRLARARQAARQLARERFDRGALAERLERILLTTQTSEQ